MKLKQVAFLSLTAILLAATSLSLTAADSPGPVTPDPSPEAVELLEFLYEISGRRILTGQHSPPLLGSTRLSPVHRATGHYPAVFGQDFGFSYPGYWDGINFRQRIVDDAILRHRDGFIITLMWHAVPPTQDEPVKFRESIQSDLTGEEWTELITPGTDLNERWQSQVDVIAWFLRQLRDAGVPVLWRPYHEMNGTWFWWGKQGGDDGYKRLWQMMYDRLVNFHKLNNLIWVYNTNEVKDGVDSHETYFPGHDYVDVLATDVYSQGFDQLNYDTLLKLAEGKPIALGEVGSIPSLEKLKEQPRWTWFMSWGETRGRGVRGIYGSKETLTLDELPWVEEQTLHIHHPYLK